MKHLFFTLATLSLYALLPLTATAQQPAFITDSLDSYIRQGMKDWDVPGLAIAIVKDGKVVVMKGYGVRDVSTHEPVDENTLFMIASNTKLFTATALAQLEYRGRLSLDDRITKYFPSFRVYDSTTTRLVTIRDMLSHHLGTKTFQGDFTFWNSNLSRQQIIRKMRLLKPSQNFRQSFGYCNSCYITAGEIIPVVTKSPWEVYVYDSIVEPLGMTNTHTLGYRMEEMPDAARPYTNTFSRTVQELPYDQIDNQGPAGSIVSCVSDLSHWLLLQLDSGRYGGKQLLPWPVLARTREMQTIISSTKSAVYPSHYVGYSMGLFQRDYNGRQVYWHTGGADGFVTSTCLVPEEKLGITILTNNDNQAFFELLRYQILNAYLGVPYENLSKKSLPGFEASRQDLLQTVEALEQRVKGNAPPLSMGSYTGTFQNELYGPIDVMAGDRGLRIHFNGHQNLSATLEYMDNGEWLLTYSNPAFGIFPVHFNTEGSRVVSIDIKVNEEIESDPYRFFKQ